MATGNIVRNVNKIFVANLPWTIGSTELKHYFSQFGHIASANVIFNRETGLSKHYGFVEVTDKKTYEAILSQQSHKIEGRMITVKYHVE